jgi:16S rRNA (guanine966-N2)-methyltransferase
MSPRPMSGGAGRVIAGAARGVRLAAPGQGTRPLGDRLKQALFAILEPDLRGGRFLDLFAGSGAGGIEALSRGAAAAVFVERDPEALRVIAANLAATRLADRATVVRSEAISWLGSSGAAAFDVVLLDPPYDKPALLDDATRLIEAAGPGGALAKGGVLVAKHFWKAEPAATRLLRSVRRERFGDTILTFLRWADEVAA